MTMDDRLFKAILSMDAYNRGYDAGIRLDTDSEGSSTDQNIGNAVIVNESDLAQGSDGVAIGFYALAYDLKDTSGNVIETTISYRGTDYPEAGPAVPNPLGLPSDIYHGWLLGGGFLAPEQGVMAVEFFNAVVDQKYGTSIQANDNHMRPRKAA